MPNKTENRISALITLCVLSCIVSFVIFHDEQEYGLEKDFVIDKNNINFRTFRPTWKEDFYPDDFFYYIQEADNADSGDGRKIIVRSKSGGIFFAARVKDPSLKFKKGNQIKLEIIRYWQSPTALIECLVVK